jgi:hypothetical protein
MIPFLAALELLESPQFDQVMSAISGAAEANMEKNELKEQNSPDHPDYARLRAAYLNTAAIAFSTLLLRKS